MKKFSKLGTIDLRTGYLRPGLGHSFEATGYTLRTGKKVAANRIELVSETQQSITVGTGAYIIAQHSAAGSAPGPRQVCGTRCVQIMDIVSGWLSTK